MKTLLQTIKFLCLIGLILSGIRLIIHFGEGDIYAMIGVFGCMILMSLTRIELKLIEKE